LKKSIFAGILIDAMFNRISSLILAILLFLLLLGSAANFYVVLVSTAILVIATLVLNYKRLGFSWPQLLLPCFYLVGVGAVFMILPSPALRLAYLLSTSFLFYLLELNLGKESHLLQNIYLSSVFMLYLGIYAFQFYFHLGNFWLVALMFAATYLFIVQGFAGFSLPAKRYFKFLVAWVLAQLAWGLSLWPTHFMVNAVLSFCMFYLLWIFAFSAFFGKLTHKKIYWQLTLVGIVILATLLTASWKPIVR
jgi:hypothetical protein